MKEHTGLESDKNFLKVEQDLRLFLSQNKESLIFRSSPVIPVVIHIVRHPDDEYISQERILSQMERLNLDFNGENHDLKHVPEEFREFVSSTGIKFCIASTGQNGINTLGIIRKETTIQAIGTKENLYFSSMGGSDAWNTDRYLNIWVANTGDHITGFGTYPLQLSPERQGIVVHPKYFGVNSSGNYNMGRVLVHEAGHYFGLFHIWDDNAHCDHDDGIEDTPMQSKIYFGCPEHPQFSCESMDMFMNFMDYTDDECMIMFTSGQMKRMKAVIELFRTDLLNNESQCISETDSDSKLPFILIPNVNSGYFKIRFNTQNAISAKVEVFNCTGIKVFEKNLILDHDTTLDLPKHVSGFYFVRIGKTVRKMIIID